MKVKLIMILMKERRRQNGKRCEEEGINMTLGEGTPQEEALEDPEDDPANDKITSMQVQMKVL